MAEPNHTLNQRREDRLAVQPQATFDLWKPAMQAQADMLMLWARGVSLLAQTMTNFAEKMRQ